MTLSNFFIDSNIILYLPDINQTKREITEKLLAQSPHVNSQVMVEVANVCKRKFSYTKNDVLILWDVLLNNSIFVSTDKLTIDTAMYLLNKYDFQIFDAIIIAGALLANCSTLYSEDLQHNQVIENKLTIKNPFL